MQGQGRRLGKFEPTGGLSGKAGQEDGGLAAKADREDQDPRRQGRDGAHGVFGARQPEGVREFPREHGIPQGLPSEPEARAFIAQQGAESPGAGRFAA